MKIDGVKTGLDHSLQGITSQITLDGYLKGIGITLTFGAISSADVLLQGGDVIKNIPNYDLSDLVFGAGLLSEKVAEVYLLKKSLAVLKFELGLKMAWVRCQIIQMGFHPDLKETCEDYLSNAHPGRRSP